MNDSRPTDRFNIPLPGPVPQGPRYSPPADPAYADQASPYAPTYGGHVPPWAPHPNETSPTDQLPTYWQQGLPPPGGPSQTTGPPEPGGPKSPRWLWVAAGAAVLMAVALVIALVLANDALKTQTAVPPLPAMPEPGSTTPSPSTRTSPLPIPAPVPPTNGSEPPTDTTGPAAMHDVVYSVNGEGRAISLMYIDSGDMVETEFNVALPWSKEFSLSKSAVHPANVTIVNIGHNVTCSVTIDGVQMSKRVGVGLTICDARG